MYFFMVSVFFLFSNEEKIMMCVVFLFYVLFLFWNGSVWSMGMLLDDLSFSMVMLTLVVMMIVFNSVGKKGEKKHFFLCLSMVVVLAFFLVNNVIFFFVLFEFSLLPIFFLISFWGVQPERLVAIKYALVYTLVASSPLLYTLLDYYMEGVNLVVFGSEQLREDMIYFSLLAFFVKIPLFFFHSWLPKAHVEAPLEGSMILAGVMLKVGMYGMIRILSLFSYSAVKEVSNLFFIIGLAGSSVSMLVAVSSDDMKMSVAFSSISHMNLCVASMASIKVSSIESLILVMFSHGLCSPMMFFLVTKIYNSSGSRSMLISKGMVSKFPFLQFLSLVVWSINVCVPPSMGFMGEVSIFLSIFSVYVYGVIGVFIYFILSSFFSIFNYGVQSHSSNELLWKKGIETTILCNSILFSGLMVFFFFFFSECFLSENYGLGW